MPPLEPLLYLTAALVAAGGAFGAWTLAGQAEAWWGRALWYAVAVGQVVIGLVVLLVGAARVESGGGEKGDGG